MPPGSARDANLATLDNVVGGIADQINNTLAIVLLNVEYLDDVIDELAESAGGPRGPADAVIGDVIGAITRLRDIVRDMNVLTGDEDADAAETLSIVMRLVRPELTQHTDVIDAVRGPAPTGVSRRQLATIAALAAGEVQRALADARATLAVAVAPVDGQVALTFTATIADGEHRLDGERGAWRAVRALLGDCHGALAIEPGDAGFAIELRVPGPRSDAG